MSKRELVRRLGTSAAQLYRLLDQTNYRKSVDQLVALLQVLDCEIDVVVRAKTARCATRSSGVSRASSLGRRRVELA